MPPPGMTDARLAIEVVPVSLRTEGLAGLCCTRCLVPLDIHQPDEAAPYRLLGTCPSCRGWTLVEVSRDGSHARLAVLPSLALDSSRSDVSNSSLLVPPSGSKRPRSDAKRHDVR